MRRTCFFRICAVLFFGALLSALYWRTGGNPPVHASPRSNPNVIWEIGAVDNSADEFGLGAKSSLTYAVSAEATPGNWRERQEANGSVYKIVFPLDQVPQVPLALVIDGFFMEVGPRGVIVNINGKRGLFHLPLQPGRNLDQRQANAILYTRTSLRVPVDPEMLRSGPNEIAISLDGNTGILYYDALRLEKSSGAIENLTATVEPTIFYRRAGEQLKELTRVIVRHRRPIASLGVSLKIGASTASAKESNANFDFGETIFDLDVSAVAAPQPYALTVESPDGEHVFTGEFRPAKKWKLFAGLKIHNDIGYTDLPQNVEELDTRNIDNLIGIMGRFPFYRFNLETSWLVDNYLHSRTPARAQQLMNLAKSGRMGVSGLYLNLPVGLCSGEELYRAMYFSKSLNRKYGVPMKFASLTDTPSQPWSLPSLLADAGIIGFALGSNQHRGMLLQNSTLNEDSPFYWEGPDGRRVMAWFARSYYQLVRLKGSVPVEDMRRTIPQFLARYTRDNYPVDAVYVYGLGGDNEDIGTGEAATIAQWNDAYAYPKLITATDGDYYDYLAKNFAGKLPVYRGDGGSYWADAAGTSTAATTLNRDTQRLLPLTEMIAGWASLFDPAITYPAAELRDVWKDLLFYDEHTWGAHNSITQPDRQFVHDGFDFKQAHAVRAHQAASNLLTRAMNRLVQYISVDGPTLFVFNPDLRPRTGIVEVEFEPQRQIVDLSTGQPVPMDVVLDHPDGWRRVRFLATGVPGLGYKAYAVRRESSRIHSANVTRAASWEIESRYYRITLDSTTGAITRLYDKELNRDLVDPNAPYKLNQLVYAAGGERQRIIRDMFPYKATDLDVSGQSGARLIENVRTPLGQRIRITAQAKNVPLIESEITVYDTLKRIDIRDHIRKEDIRAKEAIYFAFPFRTSPPQFLYQVQNAWTRPNEDQLPGACREWFTTPNLVVSRDEDATIAFATPDLPLVTLTDINRGRWPTHLDIANGHVFSYVTNNYWSTNIKASQGGDISFRYSITSRKRLDYAALGEFDSETRSGLAAYPYFDWGNVKGAVGPKQLPAAAGSFLNLEASSAQVTVFKQAEDGRGYVLRLRETTGRDGAARLRSPLFRIASAFLTDGVEEDKTPLILHADVLEIPLKANRFSTVRLLFARLP
jgi:alpha-mannosidase